jgi:tripartite-type tricarboxylate transporter receptor subunit TctC
MGTSASAPYVALVSKFWVVEDVITRSRTASGHVVVGFAAGGPTNILARLVGQWLSERLGQQFVIENRPGAGGALFLGLLSARRVAPGAATWQS